jgi:hypothetical protein
VNVQLDNSVPGAVGALGFLWFARGERERVVSSGESLRGVCVGVVGKGNGEGWNDERVVRRCDQVRSFNVLWEGGDLDLWRDVYSA